MKFLTLKFFIVSFLLLIINISYSDENIELGNLVIHEKPIKYYNVVFKNIKNEKINLNKYENNLVVINFWATWCLPCREEMPFLDALQNNNELFNIKILPINVGNESKDKQKKFFSEINIKNLEIFFDLYTNLPNKFMLRGLPTTILINKKGEEFARIVGSYDFNNKKFINWLKDYN